MAVNCNSTSTGEVVIIIRDPPTYLLNPITDCTVEFWVYYNTSSKAVRFILLPVNYGTDGQLTGWQIQQQNLLTSVRIRGDAVYKDGAGEFRASSGLQPIAPITSTHVAFVKAGSTFKMYLNGNESVLQTFGSGYAREITSGSVGIGKYIQYSRDGFKIQEFRCWDHARAEEEIQLYMNSYVNPNSPGLDLYYKMNDQSGLAVCDSSPNGRHGTLSNESRWIEDFVQLNTPGPNIITGSITFHGHSSGTFGVPVKTAVGSIAFRGHAGMFLSAIKTAVGSITFHGSSTMSLIGLVLRELEGIYQISSSEIFSRNQPVLSEDLANYIEVYINPLVPALEPEEVYKSDEEAKESIPAGETKTFTVEYSEEPVIETVATLTDAGPNLSIVDTKYYDSSAEITITNSGTATQSCIIVVSGKPLEAQGRRKIVVKDEESILDHGLVKYKFDSPLVQDETAARDLGEKILRMFAVARANIEIEWRGDPALELADICQIPEYERLGISKKENFYVTKQEFTVEGGLRVSMTGRKIPEEEE